MLRLFAKHTRSLVCWEETPYERRFGVPFNGPVIPFGSMVEYHPISAKDLSRLHQFGKKVLPGIILGYVLYAGRMCKGDILVTDIGELEKMDASEIHARRVNAKEVFTLQNGKTYYIPDRRWNSQTLWRRSGSENIHLKLGQPRPRRRTGKSSGRIRRADDGEARKDFWPISGNYIYCHHVQPRVKLFVPREESFPIPLRKIDVTKATSTTLDVMLERRIDDYWNIEGNLSDSWTGFTRFTILDEKPPDGYTWSGDRLTKKQSTSRLDYLWPGMWKDMSEAAQRKEKQKWAIEKPKHDNARRLRGISFIDPADAEFKETIKNALRKLEVPMPAALLRKIREERERKLVALLMLPRQNTHAPLKPTNLRENVWKELYIKIMKTTLQGKESTH